MAGSLQGYCIVYHKRYDKLYPVMCNDTVYMPDLSKNSFSVKFAMTKGILRYQRKKNCT